MKITILFLREKAFSRLGICSFFGLCVWVAAIGYQTSIPPGNLQKSFQGKDGDGASIPVKTAPKADPKRVFKEVVVNQ